MEQGMLNNRQQEQLQGIAALGRNEDTYLAHVAPDEMIVPAQALRDNPLLKVAIEKSISNYGIDPNQFLVGNGGMDLNPLTGLPEFGFLSKVWKKAKKALKVIAPIAAVVPGPWQPFAAVYQKGNALNNIAKGDGGIGDLLTLGAGGSQKLFGDKGALANIKAGTGITDLGFVGKNLAFQAKDLASSPLNYLGNIGKTYLENQKQGYGGIFSNVGGSETLGGQAFNTFTSTGSPIGGMMTQQQMPGGYMPQQQQYYGGGFMPTMGGYQFPSSPSGYDPATGSGQSKLGLIEDFIKGNKAGYDPKTGSGQSRLGMIEDFIKGGASGVKNLFVDDGKLNTLGAGGLAALMGKIAYDQAKSRSAGLAETPKVTMDQLGRYEMSKNLGMGGSREDFGLAPAPVALDFNMGGPVYGYNYGGPVRQYFNQGGLAMVEELDMRDGGESEGPGTGTSDDIPAMLSDGEFVMTAAATRGAGSFNVNKPKSGIELIKGGSASRKKGVENMRELMNIFEAV